MNSKKKPYGSSSAVAIQDIGKSEERKKKIDIILNERKHKIISILRD